MLERAAKTRRGDVGIRAAFAAWHRAAVVPRSKIARLLPSAGAALIGGLVALNVALGLLPVAFILATSVMLGGIPAAMSGGTRSAAFEHLVAVFSLAAAIFLAQQLLAPIQSVLGERMKRRVDGRLQDETVRIVMGSTSIAPMEDRETLSALSEAARLFDSGWNTPGTACSGLLALIARYLRLAALLVIVGAVVSWPGAVALGTATLLFRYGQRGGLRKYSAVWREVAGVNRRATYLRELAVGADAAKELRVFGLVEWFSQRYADSFRSVHHAVAARRRHVYLRPYLIYAPLGLLIAAAVMAAIVRAAAEGAITVTEFVVAIQASIAALLLGEFYAESDVPTQFGMQAVTALDEVRQRVRRLEPSGSGERRAVHPEAPARALCFDDVSFSYPGSQRLVLDGLTLELPVGKSTAIVGVNGAGKTTLVKLMARLYEPTAGVIRADDVAIAELEPVAWRRQIGVIFQDFVRYELSAADNIAFGAVHLPRDERLLRHAAAQAGILDAFSALPLGLDTPLARVYPGGIDLSGGQWQRIAIARSLYALGAGARVLILDEPTAALDVRAEMAFFERFVELTRGVTSLLISHRFSSVRHADRIVVIDGGRAVEQGSHEELLALDGRYARLFRLQAERFADDVNGRPRARAVSEADGGASLPEGSA